MVNSIIIAKEEYNYTMKLHYVSYNEVYKYMHLRSMSSMIELPDESHYKCKEYNIEPNISNHVNVLLLHKLLPWF